jgi:hypothetical protein
MTLFDLRLWVELGEDFLEERLGIFLAVAGRSNRRDLRETLSDHGGLDELIVNRWLAVGSGFLPPGTVSVGGVATGRRLERA